MRIVGFLASAILVISLILILDRKWGTIPPMGRFLSPQVGFWQNAEPSSQSFDDDLRFPNLKGKAEVYFDERLVPHVFAENDEDLYFIVGYIHARFRLFQMDLSTRAAAGRASEIAGPKALEFDREQRRLGMVFAAENAQRELEKDSKLKSVFDAYTNGVNAYISSLTKSTLPLEYKLLDFMPEKWSNLRSALLLKMMAKMLSSGTEKDLAYTNAKTIFSPTEFNMIYPQVADSLRPIIPPGTLFDTPGVAPVQPITADSLYFNNWNIVSAAELSKPDEDNGSNNWVVAGSKTKNGAPILCNDPHLELSLPSIWFEMQLRNPESNTYGVSLPGSPFIVIGFNDHIAWGLTNSQRDVKDFYEIRFKDAGRKQYWFNGKWTPTQTRYEDIKISGKPVFHDTVTYTVFGPVMFDESFSNDFSRKKNFAVRWVAHDPSVEGITLYRLNRANNYDDYVTALKSYSCPGQNFVFASKTGDIAIWQQGKFPARWPGQGLFIMPGEDSSYMWQGFIPQQENPHSKNPERGYLESANQRPVDSTYPYFIPGTYITPRAYSIDRQLASMSGIEVADMMRLQNNYFNTVAEGARGILLGYVKQNDLNADEKKWVEVVRKWNLEATPGSIGQTVFQCWWDSVKVGIWKDDVSRVNPSAPWPDEQTTLELLKKDSAMKFIDDIHTPGIETLWDIVTAGLKKAAPLLKDKEESGNLEWAKFKRPGIYHILDPGKKALLPFDRTDLNVGGTGNIINAVTQSHGPSWRMIVQLSSPAVAFGVYPGGQSGNPGSRFYDDYVAYWESGKYYTLWMMQDADRADKRIKWTMKFRKE